MFTRFYSLFCCFDCWTWKGKYRLGMRSVTKFEMPILKIFSNLFDFSFGVSASWKEVTFQVKQCIFNYVQQGCSMRECMVEKSHTKLVTLILLFFMLIITVIKTYRFYTSMFVYYHFLRSHSKIFLPNRFYS